MIKDRKVWNVKAESTSAIAMELMKALGIGEVLATLIVNRGYTTIEAARSFLEKSTEILHDPFLLNDMEKGAKRILDAVKNKENICIYGDYDVDGVTSVSILYMYLEKMGASVRYYIPSRKGEGYGVSEMAINKLNNDGTDLIITVDTGVTANKEVEIARGFGIDVVITDHHECQIELPSAVAVINPKRHDSTYPFQHLAGVGVVFKLLCALEKLRTDNSLMECVKRISYEYADLTAIGTIADVMPVKDENRLIISLGLNLIEKTDKIGLAALINLCRSNDAKSRSKSKKKISSGFIGFTVAPRINAAGRISDASMAVELFLSKDAIRAEEYAAKLCDINKDRQLEENRIADEAYAYIEENGYQPDGVIILDDNEWHHGVIGIVASRISERYCLPAILISFEGNEAPDDDEAIGKGSGRSVHGMNLVDALLYCSDLLERFGGHELAAGLTVKKKNLPALKEKMNEYASHCFNGTTPTSALDIDCYLDTDQISISLASDIGILEPYGVSNPVPTFAVSQMIIEDIVPVGMNRHLKLILSKNGKTYTAMRFCVSIEEFEYHINDEVDVAFNLEINDFMNVKNIQFNVKDIRLSDNLFKLQEDGENCLKSIKEGKITVPFEELVPQRSDFALVYNFLLKEAREGKNEYSYIRLLCAIHHKYDIENLGYIKLKMIIKIFRELNIISIDEIDTYNFKFKFNYTKDKTNLEKSNILKKLKNLYPSR